MHASIFNFITRCVGFVCFEVATKSNYLLSPIVDVMCRRFSLILQAFD